jgi:mono/diheme cytochrome c family protein
MKLAIKIALGAVVLFIVVIGGCLGYIKGSDIPVYEVEPTGITASSDPEVIARGAYLANGPMHCTSCHMHGTPEDALSKPPGSFLGAAGGYVIAAGPFGTFRPINLTPHETGTKNMSDEHLARVIKYGIGEDGKTRPFMALAVGTASDEDVRAVVSWIRSLEPVDNPIEPDEYGLIGEWMVKSGKIGLKTLATPTHVPPSDEPSVARGEYLANGPALCVGCHSPQDPMEGFAITGEKFSGCLAPESNKAGTLEVCPPNLTPSKKGMTSVWNEDKWLERVSKGYVTLDSNMPWGHFASMTDSDLRSIWRYLSQLPAVERDTGPGLREPGSHTMPD